MSKARVSQTSVNRNLDWKNSKKVKSGKHDFVWVPVTYEGDQIGTGLLMWRPGEEYVQKLAKYLCWSISEGFVAYRKPNGDYDGFLAQMAFDPMMNDISDPDYMRKFSGLVINADMNENILRTWRFLEGRMIGHSSPAQNKQGRVESCVTTTTQYTTISGQSCGPNCTEVTFTLHTTTNVMCDAANGSDPGYMGSGTNTTGNWTGQSGGGTTSTPTAKIKNNIKNPCLKNVFDTHLSANFNNRVQQILLNFNKSSNLTFNITDGWITDYRTNAETTGNSIVLNNKALADASQEYIARVLYHEVLHVYIGSTNDIDHATMSVKYVNPMIQALMTWFPITLEDATALAWGGLHGTAAYIALGEQTTTKYEFIQKLYKNYGNEFNRQYGHRCP